MRTKEEIINQYWADQGEWKGKEVFLEVLLDIRDQLKETNELMPTNHP